MENRLMAARRKGRRRARAMVEAAVKERGEQYEFPLISILHCDDRLNKHEKFPWRTRTTIKRSLCSESENKAVTHCGDNCYTGRTDADGLIGRVSSSKSPLTPSLI